MQIDWLSTVTAVKFAHDDKSRLACCSLDGQVSVCQVIPPPATVICQFDGHTSGVTGAASLLLNSLWR